MIKIWKERALARLCSGAMAAFRKNPLKLRPEDLRNVRLSFSQFGEDLVIADNLLNRKSPQGIYIDAGCFDPFRYSNTRLLNLLGWRGINIDAADDVVAKFDVHRKADFNVCAALSNVETDMQLATEGGPACRRLVRPGQSNGSPILRTTTLASMIRESPFNGQPVDLLDIDCEGHDFEVLQGFPFERVKPLIICIEAHSRGERERVLPFLAAMSYSLFSELGPSQLFRQPDVGHSSD